MIILKTYLMLLLIQDTILIGICNSLTSLYAGLVVFGVVGFISVQTGTDIDKVYSIEKRTRTNITSSSKLTNYVLYLKYFR